METIGGFALQLDSRPTTPLPTVASAQTAEDGEVTPTPTTAATPTLDQELQSVMAGIGSFWGKVRKQSVVAYQTAEKQLAADLSPLVTKARAQAAQLQESTKAELQRLSEASAAASASGSNVMIGADGTPVIVDEPLPRVDKGKGVDPAERGDEAASPAQAATAFFASLQTSIAANPNLSNLSKNFQTSLSSAQSHLTQAQTQLQSNLAHLPAQLQQLTHVDPAAAEAYLHKGESWLTEFSAEVQRLAKDAVRVVPPTSGEGDERSRKREERLRRAEEVSIGRTDVLVLKLRSEPAQLLVDPAQPHEGDSADTREHFARFLQTVEDAGGFEGAVWAARVAAETDEKLARMREELVGPGKLTPEAFWSRYFFRREEIDNEERRRKAVLLQGSGAGEADEDFSWDMEDDASEADTPGEAPTSLSASTSTPTLVPLPGGAVEEHSTPTSPSDRKQSPRASSDGASSYDVVGEQSGTPSEVGDVAEEPKPRAFAQTRPAETTSDGEDSDWE